MSDLILTSDAFARAFSISKSTRYVVFLGAGASITSGIPSAETCIWEWKRSIVISNNVELEQQFSEISLKIVKERIQSWLDKQGNFPELGSQSEYGFYIEHCYPLPEHRQSYFREKIRLARPYTGYKLLSLLSEAGKIHSVWTTNFDNLMSKAASDRNLTPIEVSIDTQTRLPRSMASGELLCVSLHGDYRYDRIKNTSDELQQYEIHLHQQMAESARQHPLIVIGYSGRDDSIMSTFSDVYSRMGTSGLYWCGFGSDIPKSVEHFLNASRAAGNQAFYVPTDGFDDLMGLVSMLSLSGQYKITARELLQESPDKARVVSKPFGAISGTRGDIVKSNAYEIELPSEMLQFEVKEFPKDHIWKWLKELTEGKTVVAAPYHGKVVCLGLIDEVKDVFKNQIAGEIKRVPLDLQELRFEDGAVTHLLQTALLSILASSPGIVSDCRRRIWSEKLSQKKQINGTNYNLHDSAEISLKSIGSRTYLIIEPSIEVRFQDGSKPPNEVVRNIRNSVLGYQHNKEFNDAVNKWRTLLGLKRDTTLHFPSPENASCRFLIRQPLPLAIMVSNRSKEVDVTIRRHVQHYGFIVDEPPLLFTRRADSSHVNDTHPIRGLVQNRPFDYTLTQKGLSTEITIGVVSPAAERNVFSRFLEEVHRTFNPTKSDDNYVLPYPGFDQAYGVPIAVPSITDSGWHICSEPSTNADSAKSSIELARLLIKSIDNVVSTGQRDLVIVAIPTRWENLKSYRDVNESFDLRDFVKAHCVQKGIRTQFLEENTIDEADKCRVWWWLSLALYVKSMRTPWILSGLDHESAYVGIGYSHDRIKGNSKQIILGCSHIYSSQGLGLQYKLTKVDNPIVRDSRPFLGYEDARRLAETIRQMFFEARGSLPNRVVLHKRTPFIKTEKDGFLAGLDGIDRVEMLELRHEHGLRYIASYINSAGGFKEDRFPMRRGSVIRQSDNMALLWVHGVTDSLRPGWRYFQGGRRIPAPISLIRHVGESPLETIATEILGLSKMDWNTLDMYTKFPATIQSSRRIAQIGSLLSNYGHTGFDYRLFM